MAVRKFLDASTAHVSLATRRYIEDGEVGTSVYPHPDGYGWFLYVPDEDGESDDTPADLRELFAYARERECDYVCLDCDGPILYDLPAY